MSSVKEHPVTVYEKEICDEGAAHMFGNRLADIRNLGSSGVETYCIYFCYVPLKEMVENEGYRHKVCKEGHLDYPSTEIEGDGAIAIISTILE